jgi:peptidyl-prolyl cis-trans isomerase B (cyclophilin B)
MRKCLLVIAMVIFSSSFLAAKVNNPVVKIVTNKGDIIFELYLDKAPKTVENFLAYVESGFYNETIFHRVIKDTFIQGGGFVKGLRQKKSKMDPVVNEANNGLKNKRGMVAMARLTNPHSATSQFFINLTDNDYLNYRNNSTQGYGYCVFAKVILGMGTLDKIGESKTQMVGVFKDVPEEDIMILEVSVIRNALKKTLQKPIVKTIRMPKKIIKKKSVKEDLRFQTQDYTE